MWVYMTLLLFFSFFSQSLSDPRITEAGLFCGNSTPPSTRPAGRGAGFIPNFVREMEVLSELVGEHHWGHHTVNSTTPVYGLAQCYNDLSHTDCLLCYAVSRTRLPRCLPSISARIYLDGCFLRYDTFEFFNQSVDPVQDRVNCSELAIDGEQKLGFKGRVREVIGNVTESAVRNGGFAVWEGKGVFGLAQCWKTVSGDGCRECLEKAAMEVRKCAPSNEGRGLNAGCYLRYSTVKFFNTKTGDLQASSGSSNVGLIVTIALVIAAFLMLSLFATYACYLRVSRLKQEIYSLRKVPTSFKKSDLNLRYEMLEKATDYFNDSRKLGQGSAGSVFKGTLPNGEIVAVKRLFFNTRQWVDEFFNEVNLISSVQHKNLVKLLGCSIEGPESLLVFEYVPNNSLDQVLFDKNKVETLNWRQRLDIIVGTAEGLAYLHDGTGTRIIHRDIKSSNVLLDENLAPKIADFGLARCFGTEVSHLSTGIAGTLGYMAPEYLVRGQLTEKADVYSYGVLVLEIISGRKNTTFTETPGSLLQTVWNLYITSRLSECVDPRLKDDFPEEEASRVLQIGLLCTQASAALRPSMKEVIDMLTTREAQVPLPNQPPFLNASSMKLHGLNSLISGALRKMEPSSSSTRTSSMQSSDDRSRSVELDSK